MGCSDFSTFSQLDVGMQWKIQSDDRLAAGWRNGSFILSAQAVIIFPSDNQQWQRPLATMLTSRARNSVLVYSGSLTQSAWKLSRFLTDSGPTGTGTTVDSVRHCLYTLCRLLAPNYAVTPVTGDMLLKEPWTEMCALLVIPGGADLGYGRTLNGEGNRRIAQFVRRGGKYLGLCAGGYYGCKRCEFEVGDKTVEVIGDREFGSRWHKILRRCLRYRHYMSLV